jgi:hypothetical protein
VFIPASCSWLFWDFDQLNIFEAKNQLQLAFSRLAGGLYL